MFLCKNHFPVRKLRQKVTSDKGFGVFEKTGYKQTVVDDTDSSFMFVFRKVVEDFDDNEQNIWIMFGKRLMIHQKKNLHILECLNYSFFVMRVLFVKNVPYEIN